MNRLRFTIAFVAIIMPLSWLMPDLLLTAAVLATGIPHIILGAKYSRRGLSSSWQTTWQKYLLLLLIPLCILLGLSWPVLGLVIYFGLHHGISETYSDDHGRKKGDLFRTSHFGLVTSSYFIGCRKALPNIPYLVEILIGLALITFLIVTFIERKRLLKIGGIKSILAEHPWTL